VCLYSCHCYSASKVHTPSWGVFFLAWPTSAYPTFRYRYVVRRVSVSWTVGEVSKKRNRCYSNLQKVTSVTAHAENVALQTECTQYNCGRRRYYLQFFSGSFWILGSEVSFFESFQSVFLQSDHVPIKRELPLSFKVAVVTISWPFVQTLSKPSSPELRNVLRHFTADILETQQH